MSKSSQESSPITQWQEATRKAVDEGYHEGFNPMPLITSATIELIEGLIGEDELLSHDWNCYGDEKYCDYPECDYQQTQARNALKAQLRQSLKELNHDNS